MKNLIFALLILPLVLLGVHPSLGNSDRAGAEQTMPTGPAIEKRFTVPGDDVLRHRLTSLQYQVTREGGTEPAYDNAYWNHYAPGIYVDVISGAPLFSSIDKYDSDTGWPSFTRPLEPDHIVLGVEQRYYFNVFREVRTKLSDSHLGHVHEDGPPPTGLRYCLNSAALRFIPLAELEKEGYEEYLELFK